LISAEGTRSSNGLVAPFKSGLYHLPRLRPTWSSSRISKPEPHPAKGRIAAGADDEPRHLRSAFAADGGDDKAAFLQKAREALMQPKDAR
jgi:hypothetical protein